MQETKNIADIIIHLVTANAIQGDENRLVVVQNIIDSVFPVAKITNKIKNKLSLL